MKIMHKNKIEDDHSIVGTLQNLIPKMLKNYSIKRLLVLEQFNYKK